MRQSGCSTNWWVGVAVPPEIAGWAAGDGVPIVPVRAPIWTSGAIGSRRQSPPKSSDGVASHRPLDSTNQNGQQLDDADRADTPHEERPAPLKALRPVQAQ